MFMEELNTHSSRSASSIELFAEGPVSGGAARRDKSSLRISPQAVSKAKTNLPTYLPTLLTHIRSPPVGH